MYLKRQTSLWWRRDDVVVMTSLWWCCSDDVAVMTQPSTHWQREAVESLGFVSFSIWQQKIQLFFIWMSPVDECKVLVVHCGTYYCCYYYYYYYDIFLIFNQCMKRRGRGFYLCWRQKRVCWIFIYSESVTGSCSMNYWINKSWQPITVLDFCSTAHWPPSHPIRQQHSFNKQHNKVLFWKDKTLLFLCWHNPQLWLVGSQTTADNCHLKNNNKQTRILLILLDDSDGFVRLHADVITQTPRGYANS